MPALVHIAIKASQQDISVDEILIDGKPKVEEISPLLALIECAKFGCESHL